jgi:integrase
MSVQRVERPGKDGGRPVVRYRARVKVHGREVATRVFERRRDADAWEQDQRQRLRAGDWVDPRRGRVTLAMIEPEWSEARRGLKRRTQEADRAAWRRYIAPKFGHVPVASITEGQVQAWVGTLAATGSRASAARYLATLRSLFAFAIADGRIVRNPAASVKVSAGATAKREGQYLTAAELDALTAACHGKYADLVLVLGLCGMRWGELAGLRVGDRVAVPGQGLRLQRAVLASGEGGGLYVDTLKGSRARTVPLPPGVIPIVERWSAGKAADAWIFSAPEGGPLSESNWKRSVRWMEAKHAIGRSSLRVHDLRHTAASLWLSSGADPKVLQRVLGHASATMTMDLYAHLVDANLWTSAERVGGTTGASGPDPGTEKTPEVG